jgi:hypothetical protein
MRRFLWLSLAIMACAPDKDDSTEQDSGLTADTGSEDPDVDMDTGGSGTEKGMVVTVIPDGDAESLRVGVTQIWLGDDELSVGELIAEGVVEDGQAQIMLSDPDIGTLTDDGTGIGAGLYTVALRRDEDGDGAVGGEEPIVGVSEVALLYLSMEPEEGSDYWGLPQGWTALGLFVGNEESTYIADIDAIGIDQNLQSQDELTIAGDSDVPDGPLDLFRVSAIPADVDYTAEVMSHLIFDEKLESSWEATISGEPHPAHLSNPEDSIVAAMELPVAYADVDESESLDLAVDSILHHICHEGRPVVVFWIPEVRDLAWGIQLMSSDVDIGWSAWALAGEEAVPLSSEQGTALSANSACVLE